MKKIIRYVAIAALLTACTGFTTMYTNAATVSGQTTSNDATTTTTKTVEVKPVTETIFNAKSVPGVAAVVEQEALYKAAGLTEGEKGKFYIGDVYKADVRKALKAAMETLGGTMVSMLDIDFYALSQAGIRTADQFSEPINIMVTLPKHIVGQNVSIFSLATGETVEFVDMDQDPNTYTFSTTNLGVFAIIIK